MPNGESQEPGGWNRIVLRVSDLPGFVAELKQAGLRFRNEGETGPFGRQVQIEDPDGNPMELLSRLADSGELGRLPQVSQLVRIAHYVQRPNDVALNLERCGLDRALGCIHNGTRQPVDHRKTRPEVVAPPRAGALARGVH